MAEIVPEGTAMYAMMVFLAIAVIGMIMAIKNRVARNKLENLVKDDKLRDKLDDIEKMRKRPHELPKGWESKTVNLGKGEGDWRQGQVKPEESIDKLMDKLDEDKKDD